MKYFIDMLFGACLEISIILFVEFFYFPNPWITLLIIGIMVPIMVLTIYTLFRYIITKEKSVKDSILKGIVLGMPLGFVAMGLFEEVIEEALHQQVESGVEGFTAIGNALSDGTILITIIILTLITSELFLKFIIKSTKDKGDAEAKWKGETMGMAILSLPIGTALFYVSLETYNGMVRDIKSGISVILLVGIFVISFIIVLLVYYSARGKNIPYVLAAYIAEAALFLLCIKRFQLPFPYIPLVALGGVLLIGAAIYKGVERLFVRWKLNKK
ncbi:MAG: hypothetical protein HDR01_15870 [Lachnospiraceae bacterium]|nr:hypothetical protein [Lachnospiraceae bacterium]